MQKAVKHYMNKFKETGESFKLGLQNTLEKSEKELAINQLDKVSTSDPESRFMPSKKGKIEFSYNPQITTERNGFIIANDVCNEASDSKQLKPQVCQTMENLKEIPKDAKWSFDNSYFESSNIEFLNGLNIDAYISCQKDKSENPYDKSNFRYNKNKDEYICPESKSLVFLSEYFDKKKEKNIRFYQGTACNTCPNSKYCTKKKDGIRTVKMYPFEEEREQIKKKMQTKEAKEIYKLRKQIVEFVFGDLRENKGVISFLTRSLETVKTEFNLWSTANNLYKIWKKKAEKMECAAMMIYLQVKKLFTLNLSAQ
jgi:transposase